MYTIVTNGVIVHDETINEEGYLALSGTLTLELNRSGLLVFSIPDSNEAYQNGYLKPLSSKVIVKEDGAFLWSGRILEQTRSSNGVVTCVCEGWLGVLNDGVVLQNELPVSPISLDVASTFSRIIDLYNSRAIAPYKLTYSVLGYKGKNETLEQAPVYENRAYSVMELVQKLFVDNPYVHGRLSLTGYKTISLVNRDVDKGVDQQLTFGDNLGDFIAHFDAAKMVTVLYPIGKDGLTAGFVSSPNATTYGRITKVKEYPGISDKDTLIKAAKYDLDHTYLDIGIELSALDLATQGIASEKIDIGRYIRVISQMHGLNKDFVVNKMVIDVTGRKPTRYSLGGTKRRLTSGYGTADYRLSRSSSDVFSLTPTIAPIIE